MHLDVEGEALVRATLAPGAVAKLPGGGVDGEGEAAHDAAAQHRIDAVGRGRDRVGGDEGAGAAGHGLAAELDDEGADARELARRRDSPPMTAAVSAPSEGIVGAGGDATGEEAGAGEGEGEARVGGEGGTGEGRMRAAPRLERRPSRPAAAAAAATRGTAAGRRGVDERCVSGGARAAIRITARIARFPGGRPRRRRRRRPCRPEPCRAAPLTSTVAGLPSRLLVAPLPLKAAPADSW
ncbi:MAG: hypothetical protein HS111_23700 [Kofleriaceae bacterium]|nr:hypothetical protein [Kofleriaceae bacterium]